MSNIQLILEQQKQLRGATNVFTEEKIHSSTEPILQNSNQFIIVFESVVKSESSYYSLTLESEDEVFEATEQNSVFEEQSTYGLTLFKNDHVQLHNGNLYPSIPSGTNDTFFLKYLQVTID